MMGLLLQLAEVHEKSQSAASSPHQQGHPLGQTNGIGLSGASWTAESCNYCEVSKSHELLSTASLWHLLS